MENNNYIPEFTTTKRNGKIALWVKMPNNEKYNLGDISEQDFKKEEIQFAIICSFERGFKAFNQIIQNDLYKQFTCFNEKFKE